MVTWFVVFGNEKSLNVKTTLFYPFFVLHLGVKIVYNFLLFTILLLIQTHPLPRLVPYSSTPTLKFHLTLPGVNLPQETCLRTFGVTSFKTPLSSFVRYVPFFPRFKRNVYTRNDHTSSCPSSSYTDHVSLAVPSCPIILIPPLLPFSPLMDSHPNTPGKIFEDENEIHFPLDNRRRLVFLLCFIEYKICLGTPT